MKILAWLSKSMLLSFNDDLGGGRGEVKAQKMLLCGCKFRVGLLPIAIIAIPIVELHYKAKRINVC